MNILAVVTVIGALVVGGVVGSVMTSSELEESADMKGRGAGSVERQVSEFRPESMGFVSARPQIFELLLEQLSTAEIEGLEFMREEEKLARDVYVALYDKWGLRIFTNIAQSEQTHAEAVRDLLVKYDMADPVTDDTVGVFTNDVIQKLYDDLIEQGLASELEALKVGALIEDLDIFDLQRYLLDVDNADIALVYENLERGSRNHLRAFVSQIESRGGAYEAQYLMQEVFDDIKDSAKEKGDSGGMNSGGRNVDGSKNQRGGRGWGGGR